MVQCAAHLVGGIAVQLVRVLEQPQMRFDERDAGVEVVRGRVVLGLELLALPFQLSQSDPNRVLWQRRVPDEVEELALLAVERRQLLFDLATQRAGRRLRVRQRCGHRLADGAHELGLELDRSIVLEHRSFDALVVRVRRVAYVLLNAAAEEVAVLAAATPDRALKDHAAHGAVLEPTPTAEEGALEIGVMAAVADVASVPLPHDHLHPVKDLGIDERRVSAREALVLVDDLSEVVAIPQ